MGSNRNKLPKVDVVGSTLEGKRSRRPAVNVAGSILEMEQNSLPKKWTRIKTNNCACGLATYFNSEGSDKKLINFIRFSKIVRSQGLNLTVIELYKDKPILPSEYYDQSKTIKFEEEHTKYLLWQKEALLNIGISYLDEIGATCENIVWIDIEVMMRNPHWIQNTCSALKDFYFIQPFSNLKRLTRIETIELDMNISLGKININRQYKTQSAYRLQTSKLSGFIWAARREVFNNFNFYPYSIIGGGDRLLIDAIYYKNPSRLKAISKGWLFKSSFENWYKSNNLYSLYHNKIGTISMVDDAGILIEDIFHFWHGEMVNRNYQSRYQILSRFKFEPEKDIVVSKQGYIHWSESALLNKQDLVNCVEYYFFIRNEDGASSSKKDVAITGLHPKCERLFK